MALLEANNDNFSELIAGDDFKLVLFGATWCGPCKMYHPVVHEFAEKHPDVKILANDVDISTNAAASFGIASVPTTVAYKGGKEVARTSGMMPLEELEAFVTNAQNA